MQTVIVTIRRTGLDIKAIRPAEVAEKVVVGVQGVVYAEMRRLARRRTGELRSKIRKVKRGGLKASVTSGATHTPFIERGTRPHIIRPVRARVLRFEMEGRVVFAKYASHPGTRPYPFIRPSKEKGEREMPQIWDKAWLRHIKDPKRIR